jgi:hypothetical protein
VAWSGERAATVRASHYRFFILFGADAAAP